MATTSVADDPRVLIDSAARGDVEAFASIVERNHEDMRRVCVVVTGDEALSDEAVEAAWAIAWRRIGSVRDPGRLRPWLVSVAVNEARQLLRSRRRRALIEIPVDGALGNHGGGDPAAGIPALDLRNALARLNPDDRALLAMRYVAGFDATELGRATGRSPSGTRARLGRLLARLQKELGDD
jgi:DNA-directed RNA polymerase specialized sigma24 family protein